MSPKQAWAAFSLLIVLLDVLAIVAMVSAGFTDTVVISSGLVFLLVYFYVLYKRYHVEVVPEQDIELFTDADDLRILCKIYGLDSSGKESELRTRLIAFSRANRSKPFAWVAPKLVRSVGAALELPEEGTEPSSLLTMSGLTGGKTRSASRLRAMGECPVCEARQPANRATCAECGADLEFYAVLRESRVGKRLVSAKARGMRRKLRYDVPRLGEER